MRARHRLLVAAAVFHLIVTLVGAAGKLPERGDPFSRTLQYYAAITGANNGYGFFAPGIGSQLRALFDVTEADGKVVTTGLQSGFSHEADLRVGNLIPRFWDADEDERLRRSLAASWAGKILARHPGARTVTVRLEQYDLPSMTEFASGKRGAWEPYYRARFVLGGGN